MASHSVTTEFRSAGTHMSEWMLAANGVAPEHNVEAHDPGFGVDGRHESNVVDVGVGEVVNVELPRHVDPLGVAASFLPSEPTATQFFVTPIVAQANSIPLKLKAARSRRSRGQRLEPLEAEERRASDQCGKDGIWAILAWLNTLPWPRRWVWGLHFLKFQVVKILR